MYTEISCIGVEERLVVKGGVDVVANKLSGVGAYIPLEGVSDGRIYVRAEKIAFLRPIELRAPEPSGMEFSLPQASMAQNGHDQAANGLAYSAP
jgi:hypothetical protein